MSKKKTRKERLMEKRRKRAEKARRKAEKAKQQAAPLAAADPEAMASLPVDPAIAPLIEALEASAPAAATAGPQPSAAPQPPAPEEAPAHEDSPTLPSGEAPGAVSPARLAANRQNAQLSTGPTSQAGKAASSLNATRHCLTGKRVVRPDQDPNTYQGFEKAMLEELKPVGFHETQVAISYIRNLWRQNVNMPRREAEVAQFPDPEKRSHEEDLLRRYRREIRQGLKHDLELLHLLQRNRHLDLIAAECKHRYQHARGKPYETKDLEERAMQAIRHTLTTRQLLRFLFTPFQSEALGFVSLGWRSRGGGG